MNRTSLILLLVLALPAGAGAQGGAPAARDSAGTDTTAIPLAPIRVTVLRTPLLLSETPFAVTVERVERSGPGLTLADALGAVPGLQVDNRYNFSQGDRISVRGLGARAQFGVRGVKVLVDGIPATLPDGQTSLSHLDPRRVDRAEVVRGPASSLWGNAAGGVIQLETAPPPAAGTDGSGTAVVGAHGLRHLGATIGWGADAGGAGLRASVSRLLYAGFREHAEADKRFASARATWAGRRDVVRVVAHGVAYEAQNPGSLSTDLLAEDRTQAYAFNVVQGAGESAEQAQAGITWRHAFGPGDGDTGRPSSAPSSRPAGGSGAAPVLEVTGWALTRSLDNPIPPVIIDLARWAAGARASLRGATAVGERSVRWTVGLDLEGQWDDRRNWENEEGDRGALVLDQAERVAGVAPFVEASIPVAGPVSALAGLRYDRHRFEAEDRLVTGTDPDDSGERVMDQLSPSLGLVAQLGDASVYASAASSFETPTTTELVNRPEGGAGFNPGLEPQRAWSLEAGARLRLGDRARVHVAAYRTAIRDALIPFEVPSSPGRTFFRNAGSALHRGLELDAWLALSPALELRAGLARVDARFDNFVSGAGDDWSGNRVPGVAPGRVTGAITWTAPTGASVAVEARWVDAIPTDDANTARAPSYTVVDLRAAGPALPLAGGSLELFGGIDNLLDAGYVASVVVNAFGGRYYEPGPGRSLYVGVRIGA